MIFVSFGSSEFAILYLQIYLYFLIAFFLVIGIIIEIVYVKNNNLTNKVTMPTINFINHKAKYFVISACVIVAGFIGMMVSLNGPNKAIFAYGLDFKGGTQMEINFDKYGKLPSNKEIEKLFQDTAKLAVQVSPIKGEKSAIVAMQDLGNKNDVKSKIEKALKDKYKVETKDIQEETSLKSKRCGSQGQTDQVRGNALQALKVGLGDITHSKRA